MSLKSKLEAVIYAAEEPVTLGQLAALFADEALTLKAEQDAEAQPQAEEAVAEHGSLPLLGDEALSAQPAETASRQDAETGSAAETDSPADVGGDAPERADQATSEEVATPDAALAEAEEKRAARLRDREARGVIRKLLDELIAEYAIDGRGIEIREIAGGYRMATKPECHDAVRSFIKGQKPAIKLSLPALETLAVIAYKQPVTAPEVNEIRGVDSSGVFGSLLARKLIATAGRKQVLGRPILYKTTREFLLRFGLRDVSELPSMEEFEKMAATELEEPNAGQGPAAEPAEFDPEMRVETSESREGSEADPAADSAQTEASNMNAVNSNSN
jgi:segregation and condensation protein B